MADADDKIWNAAVDAAMQAIERAPVFPKKNHGPQFDAHLLGVVSACRAEVEKLKRHNSSLGEPKDNP